MILATQLAGYLLMALSLVHLIFPRYFQWDSELERLSLINRQMMEVHTFFVALTVFLMGILCATSAQLLAHDPLGRIISAGFAIFWFARFLVQFFWYSPDLWKGKPFETFVHITFALLWLALTILFASLTAGPRFALALWLQAER